MILLILPIINFAFALPLSVQETRQVCGDAVPDAVISMPAKRADEQSDIYSKRLSGKESDSARLKGLVPSDVLLRLTK